MLGGLKKRRKRSSDVCRPAKNPLAADQSSGVKEEQQQRRMVPASQPHQPHERSPRQAPTTSDSGMLNYFHYDFEVSVT